MPRTTLLRKSLKAICVDSVLFFAMFALVGHLTINFWERYAIQSELSTMKTSLHSLKDTITKIGKAYDNLHTELKDLFSIVEKKPVNPTQLAECMHQKEYQESVRCKKKHTLDRKLLHDYQVQTVLTRPNKTKIGVGVVTDNKVEILGYEHKSTGPLGKNAATNTKNPPKSTGITSDMSKYEKELTHLNESNRVNSYHNHHRFYKDFEQCRHLPSCKCLSVK